MAHGMRKGVFTPFTPDPVAAPVAPPPEIKVEWPESAQPTAPDSPTAHIERAIEQLRQRESKLVVDIAALEQLRAEIDTVLRQKAILIEALEKLTLKQPVDSIIEAADRGFTPNA
jgi:hypothetical protein